MIPDFSVARDLAKIERSFEKGTLYKKEWDKNDHCLKTVTGWKRVFVEIDHFFSWASTNKESNKNQFIVLFKQCVEDPQKAINEPQKAIIEDGELSTYSEAWKGVSLYRKIAQEGENIQIPGQINTIASLFEGRENALIRDLSLNNELMPFSSPKDLTTVQIVQNLNKIKELDYLVNEYDHTLPEEAKNKLRDYRKLSFETLPDQALAAHDLFDGIWNDSSAIDIARNQISGFTDLEKSNDPKVRTYAIKLLDFVKHGVDAPKIANGTQNPGILWNPKKIWNTVKWVFSPINLPQQAQDAPQLDPDYANVIDDLIHPFRMMGDTFLDLYSKILEVKYKDADKKSFTLSFTPNSRSDVDFTEKLKQNEFFSDKTKDLCFIPFVFKGAYSFYPDHIVLITLDREAGQIQYYDPQGLPPDHPDRLDPDFGFNMRESLNEIRRIWQSKEPGKAIEIVSNIVIQQEDTQNCAIYVCDAMKRRIERENFEELCLKEKNNREITQERAVMAKEIVANVGSLPKKETEGIVNVVKYGDVEDDSPSGEGPKNEKVDDF